MDDSETSTLQSAVIETRKQSLSFFNLVSQPGSRVLSPTLSLTPSEQVGEDPGDKVILSVCMKDFFESRDLSILED